MEGKNSNFLQYLEYQISIKNRSEQFIRKIPSFESEINEKKSKIIKMIDEFDDMRRRDVYTLLVEEFTNIIQKNT
jgi:AAA+ ATPase superfamily predicted ATPase